MEDELTERANKFLEHIESSPGDLMNETECKEFIALFKLRAAKYLETFLREHPGMPGRAAIWLSRLYDQPIPNVKDIEMLTIPCELREFQLIELQVAFALAGFGCSDRLIGEFLQRDKTTVSKYLQPLRDVLQSPLEPAEKDKRFVDVAGQICDGIRKRAAREAAKL